MNSKHLTEEESKKIINMINSFLDSRVSEAAFQRPVEDAKPKPTIEAQPSAFDLSWSDNNTGGIFVSHGH